MGSSLMMLKLPSSINALFTNVKALQGFQVLRQGATILIAILLAKSSLDLTDIGHYEMLFYIGFTVSAFWIGGLIQGFLARYPKLDSEEQGGFLWNAYLVFLVLSSLIAIVLLVGKTPILSFLAGQPNLPFYEIFVGYLWINSPTFLVENIYLLLRKPKHIIGYGLASFAMQLGAVLIPVFTGYGLYWAFWGLLGFAAVKHLWLLFILIRNAPIRFNIKATHFQWVYASIPLVLYALIGGFLQAFDNWLVNYTYNGDESKFAIFRYGARELPFALALSGAFGAALLPEVAGNLHSGLDQIREKSRKLFHLLFPLSIFLVLSNHWLFPLVFSDAFSESVLVFNTFLLIIISRLIFSRTVLVGLDENRVVLYISTLELPINMAISFLLVPHFGLAGIAMGTVVAFSFEKVGLSWYLKRKYGIGLSQYTDLKWFVGYSVVLLCSFAGSLYL